MDGYTSFSDIIGAWPDVSIFAGDHGVSQSLAAVWKSRGSIPAMYWDRTIAAAAHRGINGVSVNVLAQLARSRAGAEVS